MRRTRLLIPIVAVMLLCACGNNTSDSNTNISGSETSADTKLQVEAIDAMDDTGNSAEEKTDTEGTTGESEAEEEMNEVEIDYGPLYHELTMDEISQIYAADGMAEMTIDALPVGGNAFLQPILQNPGENSVIVQWFTESEGSDNSVLLYGHMCAQYMNQTEAQTGAVSDSEVVRVVPATTTVMSRIRGGKKDSNKNDPGITTTIYKHVAVIDDIPTYHGYASERMYYQISSDGETSPVYTLAASPAAGTPLRILLTSDLQIKNMCAANLQKVYEAVGPVDAILCAGDLVDVTDRAYDWFYAPNAFWRVLTGTANDEVGNSASMTYYGSPLVQSAPIYPAIGNHDVMGVYDNVTDLSVQFNNPKPGDFNTISYEEMFELPKSATGGERYYAVTIGDVRLISLELARVWRLTAVGGLGKYSEVPGTAESNYGYGDFIFEPIKEGSKQYSFLQEELGRDEYKNAGIRMVMFHAEAHSLGDNQVPAFTDPVPSVIADPLSGQNMTIYDYPLSKDYVNTVVEPLLEEAGTHLLFNAHSHLWNRFITDSGMNVLQTSNVGNTYGGYVDGDRRTSMPSAFNEGDAYYSVRDSWNRGNYYSNNDPYGLTPVVPNKESLPGGKPFLDSNTITAFSVMDTADRKVKSYYYDTENPGSDIVFFDEFDVISR